MNSTILITGGAGYIGSHTAKLLLSKGHRVVIFDNLSAGHAEAVEALARFAPGQVEFIKGDIRDEPLLAQTLKEHGAEAVMHFAAWLLVGESVTKPADYYKNNVAGAISVLSAMAQASVERFVFSSTCATYGIPEQTPISEACPQQPINAYGETKLAIERALPHFERAYGIRWCALRYFNAAGADPEGLLGEDHNPEVHLIPRAIQAATGAEPLQLFGTDYPTPDGTCLRDYVHVADLASAHLLALRALEAGARSDAYNLGTGQPASVREVINTVAEVTGKPVPHSVAPRREGDPAELYAAAQKAQDELGWQPEHTKLREIIETAWRWHQQHPEGY